MNTFCKYILIIKKSILYFMQMMYNLGIYAWCVYLQANNKIYNNLIGDNNEI